MLADALLPPGLISPETALEAGSAERSGVAYTATRWTPESLAHLTATLAGAGREALAGIADETLLAAWSATVDAFLDPDSPERRELADPLARLCALSPAGLAAGMEAVLGGVRREPAAALLARARPATPAGEPRGRAPGIAGPPALVVLAANLPALAVQPLLPLLALRRPVLLKSPTAEPLFAPAFLAALVRRAPSLAPALAAATWPGGDHRLEDAVLAGAATVVAYGGEEAIADLRRRAPGRVLAYGPKTSFAVVGREVAAAGAAEALARDVALFDQRGCLSIAAIYTEGTGEEARELARELAAALERAALRWPPGPAAAADWAAVQQLRLEADLRGLYRPALASSAGTVVVEERRELAPSPGLRTVRVHPLVDLGALPGLLAPWQDRLQGAALAGAAAWALAPALAGLGVSRFAAPGELQSPDASWHNGGIDPLAALGAAS